MINLDTNLSSFPRVGEKYTKALKKLGIVSVRDLLWHFPFRYEDYSLVSPIAKIFNGQTATVIGKIIDAKTTRTWKRKMFITEILLQDDSGAARAVWFNQAYLADSLKKGKEIRLSGKVSADSSGLFFSNPVWEFASREPTNTGRLVPVYPETEGVSSRWLRWQIQSLLKLNLKLIDPIPTDIIKKLKLLPLNRAIKQIHFPDNLNNALVTQKRFAFEEMFLVQLKSLQVKLLWDKEHSVKIKFNEKLIKDFVESLPFKLTNAQRKASFQILKDLEKSRPMNRLLNGDVGSGKTVVAAIASLQAVKNNCQVALMAPTEVLARQHFENFCKLFSNYNLNIALLTNSYRLICHPDPPAGGEGSNKKLDSSAPPAKAGFVQNGKRERILKNLQLGNISLIIGTHALIQKDIRFKNLALIIVDEQHRFGVSQRAYLQQKIEEINDGLKNAIPHLLTMTATPIPRTLALAFFGNLDLSILDEMPKDRKRIITKIVGPLERQLTYDFIRKEIKNGRQCFVILPLVEESKVLTEVKAATQECERLSQDIFPDLKLGLIHGRLKAKIKEEIMAKFKNREIDILVATAVVEVGIDIPNATAMIIEDADRFGLSQLHQFRGRIGRSKYQSYCFLFSSSNSASVKKRLKALVESEDGFKIAEQDLALRGPGEFFGTRQSGLPDIAMENLANVKLIQIAREEAQNIIKESPSLNKYPELKKALQKFEEQVHLE